MVHLAALPEVAVCQTAAPVGPGDRAHGPVVGNAFRRGVGG
ncbi:hypothetical protein BN6_41550 [Saccharothrix espanaensis DSM 44229]|uniref:Uncharacterized protein n=1 Tax=Saccharothrix espanaensis (strain ATCC 51144 / DSM 44229 / JCM 9112 / NBRC 15066 / NRRL 15764) TaxID=1179773 RepID=K0K1J5_SACES|nr:hypothetical protein BN6_41550 [Saccharothrix espanaensis DSM 44229]